MAVSDYLVFEELFVDRSELLHAQVAIVDIAAAFGCLVERQRVYDVGHDCVIETHAGQELGAVTFEQAAIVRWQTNRAVALVDRAAEVIEDRPVARSGIREGVVAVFALPDIAAHLFAQTVVVIAAVADG